MLHFYFNSYCVFNINLTLNLDGGNVMKHIMLLSPTALKNKIYKLNDIPQIKFKEMLNDEESLINRIHCILKNYPDKKLYLDSFQLELVAYYKSYHFYRDNYGIYFNIGNFCRYLLQIYKHFSKKLNIDFITLKNICFEKIFQHEIFHYLVELYLTNNEVISGRKNLYVKYYYDIYKKYFLTDRCLEEALANYFVKKYFIRLGKNRYINILNEIFMLQAPGYSLAALIDDKNEDRVYDALQNQLFYNKNYCLLDPNFSLKRFINQNINSNYDISIIQFIIENQVYVPVYIVNDNMSRRDFYDLFNFILTLIY